MISRSTILGVGVACLLALPVQAVTVTIATDDTLTDGGTLKPHVLFGSGGTVSRGEVAPESPAIGPIHTLDGVSVTAQFDDGTDSSVIWSSRVTPGCGWANDPGVFRLAGCGDTYDSIWTLRNFSGSTIEFLEIDLRTADGPGKKLWFDRTVPSFGTDDSYLGRDFVVGSTDNSGPMTATYSVIHEERLGDAWRVLTLDFRGLDGGGMTGTMRFRQDVDTIPVPAALPLLITGLGMLGFFRRRRAAA